jgi:hypothetical protein
VSFFASFETVEHVTCEADAVYILVTNSHKQINLFRLEEKSTQDKLEILFKKRFYDIAVSIAGKVGFDPAYVAEIVKLNAEHYYSKGDFERASLLYIKTIGYYEASSVIIKFLDPGNIEHLITYLEALHKHHKAEKEHTALLLNCYVHHKAIEKLRSFLSSSVQDLELFDVRTAIEVCCEVKYFDLAAELAKSLKMKRLYVKLQVEVVKDLLDALGYIKTEMSPSGAARAIKEHGLALMKNYPEQTLDLMLAICNSLDFTGNLSRHLPESELEEQAAKEEDEVYYEEVKSPVPLTVTYRQLLECL